MMINAPRSRQSRQYRWGEPCPRGGSYALVGPTGHPTGKVVVLRLRDRFPKTPAPSFTYVLLVPKLPQSHPFGR